MPQSEKQGFDLGRCLPLITLWATIVSFGLGVWLECKSPGLALIAASSMSWVCHFIDCVVSIFELKYGATPE